MSQLTTVLVTNNGVPVSGAIITAGEMDVVLTTDAEGKVTANLADTFNRVLNVLVECSIGTFLTVLHVVAGGTYEIKTDTKID